jgi:hypothetical protein
VKHVIIALALAIAAPAESQIPDRPEAVAAAIREMRSGREVSPVAVLAGRDTVRDVTAKAAALAELPLIQEGDTSRTFKGTIVVWRVEEADGVVRATVGSFSRYAESGRGSTFYISYIYRVERVGSVWKVVSKELHGIS